MLNHYELGIKGEDIASGFLRKKGYIILERNWRYRKKEIDIILMDQQTLVIAEVKCRSDNFFEEPFHAVTRKKQNFLIEAAGYYIQKKDIDCEVRFDIISIVCKDSGYTVEHLKDAFYPSVRNR